jgi:hypothetical protein
VHSHYRCCSLSEPDQQYSISNIVSTHKHSKHAGFGLCQPRFGRRGTFCSPPTHAVASAIHDMQNTESSRAQLLKSLQLGRENLVWGGLHASPLKGDMQKL